jgi:uncharacterized Rmd1/YagE family protein
LPSTTRKIKGRIEVKGRRGRRHRKLLDDLKERRGYSHLKEEALIIIIIIIITIIIIIYLTASGLSSGGNGYYVRVYTRT